MAGPKCPTKNKETSSSPSSLNKTDRRRVQYWEKRPAFQFTVRFLQKPVLSTSN